jgi:hypothetical protein
VNRTAQTDGVCARSLLFPCGAPQFPSVAEVISINRFNISREGIKNKSFFMEKREDISIKKVMETDGNTTVSMKKCGNKNKK